MKIVTVSWTPNIIKRGSGFILIFFSFFVRQKNKYTDKQKQAKQH